MIRWLAMHHDDADAAILFLALVGIMAIAMGWI